MTLLELKERVDRIVQDAEANKNLERTLELEVVIITCDSNMGGRAYTKATSIYPGFDWERGRLNITTEHRIIKEPTGK